jgi:hypothetical protein
VGEGEHKSSGSKVGQQNPQRVVIDTQGQRQLRTSHRPPRG